MAGTKRPEKFEDVEEMFHLHNFYSRTGEYTSQINKVRLSPRVAYFYRSVDFRLT